MIAQITAGFLKPDVGRRQRCTQFPAFAHSLQQHHPCLEAALQMLRGSVQQQITVGLQIADMRQRGLMPGKGCNQGAEHAKSQPEASERKRTA